MPNIKLYYNGFSNNSLRAIFYLKEKKLEHELINVDLFKGAHKQEDFLKVNPRGQVPCLVYGDDIAVWESTAIIDFLEREHPEPSLIPTAAKDRADYSKRMAEFHQKLDSKNIFGSVFFRKQGKEELGDRLPTLKKELAVWDKYLEGKDYLAGTFSIADIVVYPMLVLIGFLGINDSNYPNINAWLGRIKNRETVKECTFFWEAMKDMPSKLPKVLLDE